MEAGYRNIWRGTETHLNTNRRILVWSTSPDDVPLYHQILQMFEDNYPEGLKRLFVIKGEFPSSRHVCHGKYI